MGVLIAAISLLIRDKKFKIDGEAKRGPTASCPQCKCSLDVVVNETEQSVAS